MTRFRDRIDEQSEAPQDGAPAGAPEDGNLDQLRREARDLLSAGNDAITRALSRNSEQFLIDHRQTGGQ